MEKQDVSVADRMDRLPASGYFFRLVARISLGGFFEYYDLFLAGAIGATLIHEKLMTVSGLAYFLGAGFLGMFFGAQLFGRICDKFGRRNGYVYTLLFYSIFTICMAFSPSALWIGIFRFLAGVGVGAELVIVDTYTSEMTPAAKRGSYIAFGQFITFWAIPCVTFLTYFFTPTHFLMDGWRWVVLFGALGAIVVWWIRLGLPESPRWLEKHGDKKAADAIMSAIETHVKNERGPLPPVQKSTEAGESSGRFADIWRPPYRARTVMMMVFNFFQTIGFYGFASWVPTFLVSEGITLIHSLLYTSIIALINPIGAVIGMLTSDKFERKYMIIGVSLSVGAAGLIFSMMRIPVWIIIVGITLTLLNNWFSTIVHAYQAELYPTHLRATGVGFTASCGRISSVISGIVIAAILQHFGVVGVFVFLLFAMIIDALVIGIFGPRTSGRSLEEISQTMPSGYKRAVDIELDARG